MTEAEAIAARTIAGVVKMHSHYDRCDPHAPTLYQRLADAIEQYGRGFSTVECECIRSAALRELDAISCLEISE